MQYLYLTSFFLLLCSYKAEDISSKRYNPIIGLSDYKLKKDVNVSVRKMPIDYKIYKNYLYDSTVMSYRIDIVHNHKNIIHYSNQYSKEEFLRTVESYYWVMEYVSLNHKLDCIEKQFSIDSLYILDNSLKDTLNKYVCQFKLFDGGYPKKEDISKIYRGKYKLDYPTIPLVYLYIK